MRKSFNIYDDSSSFLAEQKPMHMPNHLPQLSEKPTPLVNKIAWKTHSLSTALDFVYKENK